MKQKLIYLLRWIFSAFVMMLPLSIIKQYSQNEYLNLLLVQIFGAFIFWQIDKFIFKKVV
jgi:hypothetical protein